MFRSSHLVATATLAVSLAASPGAAQLRENILVPNNGPGTLPLGATKGVRGNRVVIRNATIVSGRGSPGTNRGMPPEGPVDIVIENGVIADVILMDPVNTAGN
ncbi:MAG: hypothetical protein ACLGIK_16340, partial [Gemmatimonadota bacterium]